MDGNFKKEVIENSLNDIKVELDEEFDRNFQRQAFFDEQQWPGRKYDDGVGTLMQRSGGLRGSIRSRKRGMELVYSSHKPYARIHNEGGEIKVTKKMRGYFRLFQLMPEVAPHLLCHFNFPTFIMDTGIRLM